MTARDAIRRITPERCVEWFVIANLAFLGVDIALAHAANGFARRPEWAPIGFSAVATVLLLPMALGARGRVWRAIDQGIAAAAIVVGVLGMVFHLESGFFQAETLHDLVYSAPFVAPLAYVGAGLLLLAVRREPAGSPALAWWILLLALGGFAGNLGLSLLDHAQNGFFQWTEWIPVAAGAFGTSFLFVAWLRPDPGLLRVTQIVLALEAAVGVLGFVLHARADLARPAAHVADRFLFGAPAFAPLLFADLATLGVIAVWATRRDSDACVPPGPAEAKQRPALDEPPQRVGISELPRSDGANERAAPGESEALGALAEARLRLLALLDRRPM
jgi:hypothetical protein